MVGLKVSKPALWKTHSSKIVTRRYLAAMVLFLSPLNDALGNAALCTMGAIICMVNDPESRINSQESRSLANGL